MDSDLCEAISRACSGCYLSGGCCFEARPPLSRERIEILMENGVAADAVEFAGYCRLRLKPDGFCVLFHEGKCSIHSIKPETCVAGPFTFDIKNGKLQIFLKRESICPMVRFLKADRKAYDGMFETAVEMITTLVKAIPESEMAEIIKIDEPETDLVAEIRLPSK
ncbi:MAG TPA: YkgJ family cysteine cluster protein [Methanothrix sp.]|nr:YkgJ family cysteine cluster protein [Methanothrix sp.]HPT19697.1 YkgJ family cysteine cluster protein [Methanothrix sp.]